VIAALFLLAQVVLAFARPPAASVPSPTPAIILTRYAAALARLREPGVISFDYTLEQTGLRTISATHRVFRSGTDERDETLTVDGKRLSPPKVRIFRGRRNRYLVSLLAPRPADYGFVYVGPVHDARHFDYVFRLTPKLTRAFAVTSVTIDGVRFLPLAIGFTTAANAGVGSVTFGSNARWWVPYSATARATVAADVATEHLTFYTYRFPTTLPPSTFTQAHRLSLTSPAPPATGLPLAAHPRPATAPSGPER